MNPWTHKVIDGPQAFRIAPTVDRQLFGVFVSKAPTSGTRSIEIADANGPVILPFVPVAGAQYAFPTQWSGELVVTVKGIVQCTVFTS